MYIYKYNIRISHSRNETRTPCFVTQVLCYFWHNQSESDSRPPKLRSTNGVAGQNSDLPKVSCEFILSKCLAAMLVSDELETNLDL